jgi:PAS domain S-box-containing protein
MSIRLAIVVWTLALALAGATAGVVVTGGRVDHLVTELGLPMLVGLTFVAVGLVSWSRTPANRTGALMTAVGFCWYLGGLNWSDISLLFTLGTAFGALVFGWFVWLLLAFPNGRLEARIDRVIVLGSFALVAVVPALALLFDDPQATPTCVECPENLFLVDRNETIANAFGILFAVGVAVVALAVIARLALRYRRAAPPVRRAMTPVYLTGISLIGVGILTAVLSLATDESTYLDAPIFLALLAVPISFLYGLLRERLARAAVERLVVHLGERPGPGDLRQALARALGDPSASLLHYDAELARFVDDSGRKVDLAAVGGRRTVTVVERNGTPLGAIVHDVSVLGNPALLDSVTATAGVALENERRYEELRRAKDRNAALLDAVPDLIFRIGMDGVYRDFKAEDPGILTAAPSEIVGSSLHDLLPREVAARIIDCALRARAADSVEAVEYHLEVHDGLRDFEGRVVYAGQDEFLLIVRDFTDRKRQEQELRHVSAELERRLNELERERDFIAAVVNTAPSMLCLTDAEGRIVRVNRALGLTSGWSDGAEIEGRYFWDVLIPSDAVERTRRNFDELAGGGKPVEREFPLLTKDGERLDVEWIARPVRDDQGRVRFLFGGLDVTHRKRQEHELRASRARIVQAGDAARRRLERDLHDGAQQRLVALSVAIRLAKTRLRDDPDSAETILTGAADELSHALEELRELARGIHPAILSERGLAPALDALAARSPVPVDVDVPAERLPLVVEAAAYFVVSEAVANATKHAQAAALSVRVASENGNAVVEVADDGAGGADPADGTGLRGLEDRVAALDGVLTVESPAGGGTRIRAVIPVNASGG